MGDYINLAELFDKTPISKAIDEINATNGIPKERPKRHGWNFWQRYLACPYSAWLKYEEKVKQELKASLEVGIAVHGFLQWYYLGREPSELKDALIAHNTTVEWVLEAWRIYQAYAIHYSNDALFDRVLAVEAWLIHPSMDFCSREDLVVDVGENEDGIKPGLWIVDHKTSGRFDGATLECWAHDGEMLGLQMTYRDLGEPLGPLNGILVNLIGKQKMPKFERLPVSINEAHLELFRETIQRASCEVSGRKWAKLPFPWERKGHETGACVGRYGPCEHYERCWHLPELPE